MTKNINKNKVNNRANLWIVAAPSGGGKTSLVEAAILQLDNLVRSISFTTRPQRVGEEHGKDYFFISKENFEELIAKNAMLEYEEVFGNFYGTSLDFIKNYLQNGTDVILTIDYKGSRHVKKLLPNSKGIFILPPNIATLEKRLNSRGQDNKEIINKRMQEAKRQISHYNEFEYLIINDDFELALAELITCIKAERLRQNRQVIKHASLIDELLN